MRWRRQAGSAAAVLVGLPTLASAQQAAASGCFDGTVGTDARTRRAIVEVTDARRGTLHVYTRPVRRLALHAELESGVAIAARTFRSNGDSASAVIAADASVADLTIRGARESMRARLGRVRPHVAPEGITADAAGEWVATMGPGGVIRLVARLGAGPCGIPVGWFDSPDQGQHDLPMTSVRVAGDSLEMRADYLDLRIALPLRGGDERLARMRQHGVETDVRFRRGASAVLHRPQEPRRPFPYDERDARFASRAAGITLAGTLTLPRAAGPHPAVVLISGSGAQDRDETVAGHRPFLVLADHLTRLGYAVLRFDDRWAGATAGAPLQTTLHDIAQDVHGAVDYLRTLADIDPRRVGLLGHSEGGYVAPIVAATDRDIAFLVLLGAPAVTGRDVLLSQSSSLLRASGEPEVTVRVDSLIRATVFSALALRP
ncbi:MAG TPA: alpha/beta hydrolase, partial [Gemmatimonadaceae bacterium]|nr:alpha/beta hydrolase [Gemmatimonadaceae bacterium]